MKSAHPGKCCRGRLRIVREMGFRQYHRGAPSLIGATERAIAPRIVRTLGNRSVLIRLHSMDDASSSDKPRRKFTHPSFNLRGVTTTHRLRHEARDFVESGRTAAALLRVEKGSTLRTGRSRLAPTGGWISGSRRQSRRGFVTGYAHAREAG